MRAIIGIDFGSRVCRTVVAAGDRVETVPNAYAERPLPVLVEWRDHASGPARAPATLGFGSFKQKLGIEETAPLNGRASRIDEEVRTVLRRLRHDAEEASGEDLGRAVLTVPGCFTERQRAALRTAARSCFTAVRLLDESLAAVLGAAAPVRQRNLLAYALGAGVFSTGVISAGDTRPRLLASEGHRGIGGYAFDAAIAGYVLGRLHRTPEQFLELEASALRLKALAENLKLGLSRRTEETFDVDLAELFGSPDEGETVQRGLAISRAEFETMVQPLVADTIALSQRVVAEAGLGAADVDGLLLIGASTRIPFVQRTLREEFAIETLASGDVDMARGAALYGRTLDDEAWRGQDDRDAPDAPRRARPRVRPPVLPTHPTPPVAPQGAAGRGTWIRPFVAAFEDAETRWKSGDQAAAIGEFERLMEDAGRFLGNLYWQRGDALLRAGDWDGAIASLRQALRRNAEDRSARRSYHQALNRKALDLVSARRFAEARPIIREGLALDPECGPCRSLAEQIDRALQGAGRPGLFSKKKKRRR